ncbi:MAG: hypothetical protein JNL21_20075 [Myxococcales bacterium]|nr:hypothetical protein [Myxococcales bacterium]
MTAIIPAHPGVTESAIAAAEAAFLEAWLRARIAFSPYTRLAAPILCRNEKEEKAEGLEGSFAMIRMKDERIVIGLKMVAERGLAAHAHAILAHEVGHYVHAPGSLREHVRLHDRIRRTLGAGLRSHAGLVANLYTDLLLNDRLQRSKTADIAAVYRALREGGDTSLLWSLYMRAYERLWLLPQGALSPAVSPETEADADLVARVVRHFRDTWLEGAASFTLLLEPYLEQLPTDRAVVPPWMDTAGTSIGEGVPDGLIEDDFDPADVPHPALDPRLGNGDAPADSEKEGDLDQATGSAGQTTRGDGRPDRRKVVRGPTEWLDLMRAVGVKRDTPDLVVRYYRELAMPHVLPFPTEKLERAGEPLPEGLEPWEPGNPLDRVDWFETLGRSPVVIPGVTIVERMEGTTTGGEPERRPPDLYVGIDCSGSMANPAAALSYPVVAGVVLTLSALRAGARVMACLSGEWHGKGRFQETDGFSGNERAILGVLTGYLGTGASFGLPRLAKTFALAPKRARPAHILVVSDSDLFGEIDGTKDGWDILRRAVENAGAGASAVLRLAQVAHYDGQLEKLRKAGVTPYLVASEEELVAFARAFARRTFGKA